MLCNKISIKYTVELDRSGKESKMHVPKMDDLVDDINKRNRKYDKVQSSMKILESGNE